MRSSSVSPYDLQDWAKRAGFELTEETLPPLAGYLGLLIQWNRVMNLVGTRTAEDTFFTLVVDSLHLGRFLREDVEQRCTLLLGSGLGSGPSRTSSAYDLARRRLLDGRSPRKTSPVPVHGPRQISLARNPCLPGPRRSVYGRTARTDSGSHRQPGVYAVARRSGTRQRQPESQWRGRTAFARTPPRVSRLGTGRTELAYCRAIYVYGVPHPAVPVCPDRSRRTIIHKTKPSEKTSFQPIEFFLTIVKNSFQWAFFI